MLDTDTQGCASGVAVGVLDGPLDHQLRAGPVESGEVRSGCRDLAQQVGLSAQLCDRGATVVAFHVPYLSVHNTPPVREKHLPPSSSAARFKLSLDSNGRGGSVAIWGLVIETTVGVGERKHTEAYVLTHVEGTREEALVELERRARIHTPEHPRSPKRRRLFRERDGFLLVIDGAWQSFSTRFTVAELLDDSAAPPPPPPEVAPPEAEPDPADTVPSPPPPSTPPVERDADGVPVRPAWWGRTDLP